MTFQHSCFQAILVNGKPSNFLQTTKQPIVKLLTENTT